MRSYGAATADRGSSASPGYTFNGFGSSGLYGDASGGIGISVSGNAVVAYSSTGRLSSRELEYNIAQRTMTGGGVLSFVGNNVNWSSRFVLIPVSKNIVSRGYLDFVPPASGTSVPIYSGGSRAVTSNGIATGGWDALFAVCNADASYSYIIGAAQGDIALQDNYVLIYTVSGDGNYVRFATGEVLYSGQTLNTKSGWKRVTGTGYALLNDDASSNYYLGNVSESRTFTSGYVVDYRVTDGPTDSKQWRWFYGTNFSELQCVNDAVNTSVGGLRFTRNQTVIIQAQISGSVVNYYDNLFDLGTSSVRWKNLYLVNQPTVSSDASGKNNIRNLSDAEINAWSNISPRIYQLTDTSGSVSAMLSAGLIAQEVLTAFANAGLDATKYNLFDKDASGKYLLRYGECAMFEAQFQRSRVAALQSTVNQLKTSLNGVLKLLNLGVLP